MNVANTKSMKNNNIITFDKVTLFHISKLILDGRPVTGILMANEYLKDNEAVRNGLIEIAKEKIEDLDYIVPEAFLEKLLYKGLTFSKLTMREKEFVIALREKSYEDMGNMTIPKVRSLEINKKRAKEGVELLKTIYLGKSRFKHSRRFSLPSSWNMRTVVGNDS